MIYGKCHRHCCACEYSIGHVIRKTVSEILRVIMFVGKSARRINAERV